VRRKQTPILPDSAMFDIPESYQTTFNNEPFLARDVLVRRRRRMLMFCTKKQLDLLFDSPVVMMDGTFSATPPFFDQIYSIHIVKFDASNEYVFFDLTYFHFIVGFPCVFTILPNRKKYIYVEMFKELKSLAAQSGRTFQPSHILTDFEPSIIRAISSEVSVN
jgi:hypothetical protein